MKLSSKIDILPFIVVLLFIYSYYSYVIEFCYYKIIVHDRRDTIAIILLSLFHFIYFLVIWCLFVLLTTDHQDISIKYKLKLVSRELLNVVQQQHQNESISHLSQLSNDALKIYIKQKAIQIITCNFNGDINVCFICKLIKPDRCHHCKLCDKCILRMDHHCPWLNRCIGYSNQKYFILFLIYTLVYQIFILCTTFPTLIQCWNEMFMNNRSEYYIIILFMLNSCFLIPIGLLVVYSIRLVALNKTNIEDDYHQYVLDNCKAYQSGNIFNLGNYIDNLKQIFGTNILFALLPLWTTLGDGHQFDISTNSLINNI